MGIHHAPSDAEGSISIVGNTELCMQMIREHLDQKGCPLPPEGTDQDLGEEVQIPHHLVALFIGSGGSTNKKLKDLQSVVGDGAFVSAHPAQMPGGLQYIKIIGPNKKQAKELLQAKVNQIAAGP